MTAWMISGSSWSSDSSDSSSDSSAMISDSSSDYSAMISCSSILGLFGIGQISGRFNMEPVRNGYLDDVHFFFVTLGLQNVTLFGTSS